VRGEGWGEGESPQTELVESPLTRAFGATSPRTRGEVKDRNKKGGPRPPF
jgi:hypothetical protein